MSENEPQMCYAEEHTTQFNLMDLDTLKAMLAHADPDKVETVADNWKWINERLVGGESGGLKKEFDDAVDEVLEHWSGAAAEGFRRRAQQISKSIENAAPYARNVECAMRGAEAALRAYKKQLDAIEKPSGTDSAMDAAGNYGLKIVTLGAKGGRDDSKANSEIAAGKRTEDVLNGNAGELSEGKERQLQGAIVMEYLGAAYRSNAKAIGTPRGKYDDERLIEPPGETAPVPAVVPVPSSVSRPKPASTSATPSASKGPGYTSPGSVTSPRPEGITGGIGSPPKPTGPTTPSVKTGLDGLSGGAGGLGAGGGLGSGGFGGGSAGVGAGGSGAGSGASGIPGMPGATAGGVARGGSGAGARGGRAGMPGMGGGAGAGAGGAKGAGRGGGGLARQRGGVVGSAKGKSGAGSQGGSGLHRSRGGTQAGKPGGGRGAGMVGAPGARGANANEEEGRGGQRPDYLVEDEETWTPERNVAPRVIE